MTKTCTRCAQLKKRKVIKNTTPAKKRHSPEADAVARVKNKLTDSVRSRLQSRLQQVKKNMQPAIPATPETNTPATIESNTDLDEIPLTQLTQEDEIPPSPPLERTDSCSAIFTSRLQQRSKKKVVPAATADKTNYNDVNDIPVTIEVDMRTGPERPPAKLQSFSGSGTHDFISFVELQQAPAGIIRMQTFVQKLIRTRHLVEDRLAAGMLSADETTMGYRRVQARADIMCELRTLKTFLDHMFPVY